MPWTHYFQHCRETLGAEHPQSYARYCGGDEQGTTTTTPKKSGAEGEDKKEEPQALRIINEFYGKESFPKLTTKSLSLTKNSDGYYTLTAEVTNSRNEVLKVSETRRPLFGWEEPTNTLDSWPGKKESELSLKIPDSNTISRDSNSPWRNLKAIYIDLVYPRGLPEQFDTDLKNSFQYTNFTHIKDPVGVRIEGHEEEASLLVFYKLKGSIQVGTFNSGWWPSYERTADGRAWLHMENAVQKIASYSVELGEGDWSVFETPYQKKLEETIKEFMKGVVVEKIEIVGDKESVSFTLASTGPAKKKTMRFKCSTGSQSANTEGKSSSFLSKDTVWGWFAKVCFIVRDELVNLIEYEDRDSGEAGQISHINGQTVEIDLAATYYFPVHTFTFEKKGENVCLTFENLEKVEFLLTEEQKEKLLSSRQRRKHRDFLGSLEAAEELWVKREPPPATLSETAISLRLAATRRALDTDGSITVRLEKKGGTWGLENNSQLLKIQDTESLDSLVAAAPRIYAAGGPHVFLQEFLFNFDPSQQSCLTLDNLDNTFFSVSPSGTSVESTDKLEIIRRSGGGKRKISFLVPRTKELEALFASKQKAFLLGQLLMPATKKDVSGEQRDVVVSEAKFGENTGEGQNNKKLTFVLTGKVHLIPRKSVEVEVDVQLPFYLIDKKTLPRIDLPVHEDQASADFQLQEIAGAAGRLLDQKVYEDLKKFSKLTENYPFLRPAWSPERPEKLFFWLRATQKDFYFSLTEEQQGLCHEAYLYDFFALSNTDPDVLDAVTVLPLRGTATTFVLTRGSKKVKLEEWEEIISLKETWYPVVREVVGWIREGAFLKALADTSTTSHTEFTWESSIEGKEFYVAGGGMITCHLDHDQPPKGLEVTIHTGDKKDQYETAIQNIEKAYKNELAIKEMLDPRAQKFSVSNLGKKEVGRERDRRRGWVYFCHFSRAEKKPIVLQWDQGQESEVTLELSKVLSLHQQEVLKFIQKTATSMIEGGFQQTSEENEAVEPNVVRIQKQFGSGSAATKHTFEFQFSGPQFR